MIPDEILGIALTRSHLLWLALFGVIGISLLAGSVSLWLFHRRIAGPIRKLEAQAERIGHGDYRPLPQLTPHNDLARLGKALNSMAQAIARHEHHIRYLALHEQVTGLPNRAAFLEAVGATPTVGAVLVVALERAHEVANTVGREIADRVLRHVALRLGRLLGDVDLACLGEQSFAVRLPEAGEQKARGVAADIVKHFEMPYTDGDLTIDTVVAVGIALAPQHGVDHAVVLGHAEVAVKAAMRNPDSCAVYDPAYDPYRPERLSLMSELRHGLLNDQFILLYQPKLHIASGRVTGAEALVRWRHPRHGIVEPDDFVGLAEETGNIRHLTGWALRTGIAQAAQWRAEGLKLQIAINLSARDLSDPRLPDSVAHLLDDHGLDTHAISLEVTESAIMADPAGAAGVLRGLAERDLWVALDDFGVGQTSLTHLRTWPVRELKIDKAFAQHLTADGDDRKIVRSVIELGHSLRFTVTVEGVEDAMTLEVLAALGCDHAQGFYVARPLETEALAQFVRDYPPPVRAADALAQGRRTLREVLSRRS